MTRLEGDAAARAGSLLAWLAGFDTTVAAASEEAQEGGEEEEGAVVAALLPVLRDGGAVRRALSRLSRVSA